MKEEGGFDTNWLERKLIPASIPRAFCEALEAVAVDETAAAMWHREQCKKLALRVSVG